MWCRQLLQTSERTGEFEPAGAGEPHDWPFGWDMGHL
jgi:hypothetical protein